MLLSAATLATHALVRHECTTVYHRMTRCKLYNFHNPRNPECQKHQLSRCRNVKTLSGTRRCELYHCIVSKKMFLVLFLMFLLTENRIATLTTLTAFFLDYLRGWPNLYRRASWPANRDHHNYDYNDNNQHDNRSPKAAFGTGNEQGKVNQTNVALAWCMLF